MSENRTDPRRPRTPLQGPSPGLLAIVALALTLAAVLVPVTAAGAAFPPPFLSTATVAAYLRGHRELVVVTGFLTFGASVPIGIYAATIYAELQRRGVRVPGPGIAYFGGIAASVLLSLAGLLTWVLGQPVTARLRRPFTRSSTSST